MRQLTEIFRELQTTQTMVDLTNAFEGISSMQIAQTKNQVQSSAKFFADLWQIYNQIRVDELFHFGRSQSVDKVIKKELLVLITSEGSFSGDIDRRLVNEALTKYSPEKNDIIVVGHHGAIQLAQQGVRYVRSFKLPQKDRNINVAPIISEVQKYESTNVYYQSYVSLMEQEVNQLMLSSAVTQRGKSISQAEEIISEENYIFEPSTYAVVDHLERSMMQITLSELILESKLAQYASRFRAMSVAHQKANDSRDDLNLVYNRARRHTKDERLKEVMNGLRKAQQ